MKRNSGCLFQARYAVAAALIGIFVFCVRFSMLQKSAEPNGLDGYFYALQAKSLVQTGTLENPSWNCGYYACGISAFLTGDAVLGVKVWSAVSSALVALSVFLALIALTEHQTTALLGCLLCAASPSCAVMSIDYINNQTGLFFFLLYAAVLVRREKKKSRARSAACAVLFLLSSLSHKITLVYAFAFTAIYLLPKHLRQRPYFHAQKKQFRHTVALFVLAAGFLTAAVPFFTRQSPRFFHAFGWPSLPVFHKPAVATVGIWSATELSVYFVLIYAVSAVMLIKKGGKQKLLLFVPVLFFPFWNFDSDAGIRLFLSAVPAGIVVLLYFLHCAFGGQGVNGQNPVFRRYARAVPCVVLLCAAWLSPRVYDPRKDPPFAYYRAVVSGIALDEDSLLIAHLGLNHVYTYYCDLKDSLNYLPGFFVPDDKLWRLAYGANVWRMRSFFPEYAAAEINALVQPIDGRYTLVREDIWQQYLEREDEEIAETYRNWFNPYQVRPRFIR